MDTTASGLTYPYFILTDAKQMNASPIPTDSPTLFKQQQPQP